MAFPVFLKKKRKKREEGRRKRRRKEKKKVLSGEPGEKEEARVGGLGFRLLPEEGNGLGLDWGD